MIHKALSVKQPYTTLIVIGQKTAEVRSKPTSYRGDLVICSSQTPDYGIDLSVLERINGTEEGGAYPCGMALGLVELVDCVPLNRSHAKASWLPARVIAEINQRKQHFAWILANPRLIEPVKVKGKLGIFNLALDVKLAPEME